MGYELKLIASAKNIMTTVGAGRLDG